MKLSNLLSNIRKSQTDLTNQQIERAVTIILDTMKQSLAHNGRVEIRGFGVFYLSKRNPRALINPRSGEKCFVATRSVPRFRCGKQLFERLNQSERNTD